jgi:hypothetical protein
LRPIFDFRVNPELLPATPFVSELSVSRVATVVPSIRSSASSVLVRAGSGVPSNVKLTRIALAANRALDRRLDFAPQDILFVPAKNES